ncbi:MAG TPA: VOC family protein [Kaistia sp.]|nr:VOC family protein [Kaistia sp.]
MPDDHPVQAGSDIPLGKGVEIVLQVDDVVRLHERVYASGWPLAAPPTRRPWGRTDFHLVDPDDYYLRLTD